MTTQLRILHLSDLHIAKSESDQDAVLRALYESLKARKSGGTLWDLVVFSGDLAAKGNYASPVNTKVQKFLEELVAISGLDKRRIIVCPGNHDANLSKQIHLFKIAFDAIGTRQDANKIVEDTSVDVFKPFEDFRGILTGFYGSNPYEKHPLFYTRRFDFENSKVGVCVLNSAWRCRGLAENKDYGHLLVGERQIELALAEVSDCDFKIAVFHHPINWLAPLEQSYVQRLLARNFQLTMYGHNHSPDAFNLANGHSVFLSSNAGCIYQNREYFNGYLDLTVTLPSLVFEIAAFEYYPERETFAPAERFGDKGKREFVLSQDTSILEFVKPEVIDIVRARVDKQLLSSSSEVAPKSLEGVFVEPPLAWTSELAAAPTDSAEELKEIEYVRLGDLLATESRLHVRGRLESGKTTLLNHVALNAASFQLQGVITACVIDCSKLKKRRSVAAILELAAHFYASEIPVKNIRKLASTGQILFCFDDIPLSDASYVSLLREFIDQFPNARYVCTSEELVNDVFRSDGHSDRGHEQLAFLGKQVFIHTFRRKQTRQLAQRWFGSQEHANERIDEVLAYVRRLGVPKTPFLISLVLWVLENRPTSELINQAAVVEAMADGLLGKLTELKERSRLDARLKTLFMIDLAHALYQRQETKLERLEMEQFVADYFASKGWKESAFELLQELLDKGFLIDLDGQVGFKFDCFRAFFLGQKLNEDPIFFAESMTRERFSGLRSEIDYATGLVRNRADYLKEVFRLCQELYNEVDDILDAASVDEVESTPVLFDDAVAKSIQEQIGEVDDHGTTRDEFLDEMDEAPRPVAPRDPTPSEPPPELRKPLELVNGLLTLAIVIRNSEALGTEPKLEAMTWLIEKWAGFIATGHGKVESEQTRKAIADQFPQVQDAQKLEHLLKVLQPLVGIGMFEEFLATPKLSNLFLQNYERRSASLEKLMYVSFLLTVQSEEGLAVLSDFFRRGDKQTLWKEVAYLKGMQFLMTKRWSPSQMQKLKTALLDRLVDMMDSKNRRVDRTKMSQQWDQRIAQFQRQNEPE